jgi:eukaryotic-like serine/threonine-protein kinase
MESLTTSIPPPPLPRKIGRYEISRLLGQGAMGRVYLGRDPVLNRDVAVKVLRDDLGLPPESMKSLVKRMRHEAQAAARVTHPNLVTLHDMGEDANVGLFLVFEKVDGPNLKQKLQGGRLPPLQAAKIAREIGSALTLAHQADVLHRDIKPDNIMLSPTGAKIADFGIAKIPDSTLTRQGTLVGTPAYCAPEALSNGSFSPESDQFSFSATMYEVISADRAFPGDDAVGVAAKIKTDEPKPLAHRLSLPEDVDTILMKGMNKNPSLRFSSAIEFGEALAVALEKTFEQISRVPTQPDALQTLTLAQSAHSGMVQPQQSSLRIAIGAATIALVSGLVGYAASQGVPFFSNPLAPGLSSTISSASASTPTASNSTTSAATELTQNTFWKRVKKPVSKKKKPVDPPPTIASTIHTAVDAGHPQAKDAGTLDAGSDPNVPETPSPSSSDH